VRYCPPYLAYNVTKRRVMAQIPRPKAVALSNLLKGLVDLVGIEPTTSSMPWKRAPNCATGPRGVFPILAEGGEIVKPKVAGSVQQGSTKVFAEMELFALIFVFPVGTG
jgi:hypothetical protein